MIINISIAVQVVILLALIYVGIFVYEMSQRQYAFEQGEKQVMQQLDLLNSRFDEGMTVTINCNLIENNKIILNCN